ncbi:MAG: hypothetical protein KAT34_08250 [Candidatus Aminicenantes bacterium]|nr:hypothetical protein [Candidatus Aminicenantes bacterium]
MTKSRGTSSKKKEKPEQHIEEKPKQRKRIFIKVLAGLGVLLVALSPTLFDFFTDLLRTAPVFSVDDSVRNSQLPFVISAENSSAKRRLNLDVRWDGVLFKQGAIQTDQILYKWIFNVNDTKLSHDKKYTKDGEHKLEVGFNGKFQGEPFTVVFYSKPPVVEASLDSIENSPKDKIIMGQTASKLQDPKEEIKIDVLIDYREKPIAIPIKMEKFLNNKGVIYFKFTSFPIVSPKISPDDPRYKEPFFAFRVTDQAGNMYYNNISYAKFIAPGKQNFGVNRIADINVYTNLPEDVKGHQLHPDLPKDVQGMKFSLEITLDEILNKGRTEYKGEKAIELNISVYGMDFAKLEWGNLPEDIRDENSPTIVVRDDETISIVYGDDNYIDKSPPVGKELSYQVGQPGKDGNFYKSEKKTIRIELPDIPDIQFEKLTLVKKISIDPAASFQSIPRSFCVTEDNIFLLPDYQRGTVKVLQEGGNFLNFASEFGNGDNGTGKMINPRVCIYSQTESKLGVFDSAARKIFIFERYERTKFRIVSEIFCPRLGYDYAFWGDGKHLIISGIVRDVNNSSFGLYTKNIKTNQITYLLPSYDKYGLKNTGEYEREYRQNQTIPAVGVRGIFDVSGADVFFVWEGALRVLKISLVTTKKVTIFGQEPSYYTKPDGVKLSRTYKSGEFESTWRTQKTMSYVRDIFATSRYVFVVYETGKNAKTPTSQFRIQTYTPEGIFLNDVSIPGNPGMPMCFDKDNYELYSISRQSESGDKAFSILKYKFR